MHFKFAEAEEQYKKDVNLKLEDVQALLEWSKRQPHLPELTELQMTLFLHSCYYRMEPAKMAIDSYFTFLTHSPYIFERATEDIIRTTLSTHTFVTILPKQTPEGYNILMAKLLDYSSKSLNIINLLKLLYMVGTLHMYQYGTENGFVALVDFHGFSLGHLSHLTPTNLMALKEFLFFLQEGVPVRVKAIHFINVSRYAEVLINAIKPFMKQELLDMMKLHSTSSETLYNYIPKQCLLENYGSEGPTIQTLQDENIANLCGNFDFFEWQDSQKVDETKRSGKPKDANSMFGVEGSFKKLQID